MLIPSRYGMLSMRGIIFRVLNIILILIIRVKLISWYKILI